MRVYNKQRLIIVYSIEKCFCYSPLVVAVFCSGDFFLDKYLSQLLVLV